MAIQKWTVFFAFLVLFAFMEETKLAMADEGTQVSVTIRKNDKAIIQCLKGGHIHILEASYGRLDRANNFPLPSNRGIWCTLLDSRSGVRSKCENKFSCELHANISVFGDPCAETYKYLEVKFTCIDRIDICENRKTTISCPAGKNIKVLTAFYGRTDVTTCPHRKIRHTLCIAENSVKIVKNKCETKNSCSLFASSSVFGDPCVGIHKYLTVQYKCI